MLQVKVDVVPVDIDEKTILQSLPPREAVQATARAKADALDWDGRPILAADTALVLDNNLLGKPESRDEAAEMLRQLSGKVTQVMSCVALKTRNDLIKDRSAFAALRVDEIDEQTISSYLKTGEADDKAGAIGIQGEAKNFVTIITGNRSTVIGLPIPETMELLHNAGVVIEDPGASQVE